MHQRQAMDLSLYYRSVHVPQKSKTDHLFAFRHIDARRLLLILRIAEKLRSAEAEAMGTIKANLNKTSRSGKSTMHCTQLFVQFQYGIWVLELTNY